MKGKNRILPNIYKWKFWKYSVGDPHVTIKHFPPHLSSSSPVSPCRAFSGQLRLLPTAMAFHPPRTLSLSLKLSLSLPFRNSLSLCSRSYSLSPRHMGKLRASFSGHLTAKSTGGDYSEGPTWLVVALYSVGNGVWLWWSTVDEPQWGIIDPPSPTTPTAISRSPQVPFNLLVVLVLSIRDKTVRIDVTHFRTNWQNIDNWYEPSRALFWGNDLESRLVVKNDFQRYIKCLCLESFVKKSRVFQDSL